MTKEFSNGKEQGKRSRFLRRNTEESIETAHHRCDFSNERWLSAEEMCSLVKTTYTQSCDLESVNTALEELMQEGNVEADRGNQTFRRKFKAASRAK